MTILIKKPQLANSNFTASSKKHNPSEVTQGRPFKGPFIKYGRTFQAFFDPLPCCVQNMMTANSRPFLTLPVTVILNVWPLKKPCGETKMLRWLYENQNTIVSDYVKRYGN